MHKTNETQATKIAFPFGVRANAASCYADEVLYVKESFVFKTSSTTAWSPFPKGEGYFCCVRAACFAHQMPFAVSVWADDRWSPLRVCAVALLFVVGVGAHDDPCVQNKI